jgi:3-methyladenine DNA glycosylase Tag
MHEFAPIHDLARTRKGGNAELQALLPKIRSQRSLARLGNDRVLAEMTRCVFQAGFVWRVIDRKWDGFEEVFFGFDPAKLVLLSPQQLERIGQDTRIVRNMQKILSVQRNAQYVLETSREYGSFGKFVATWPDADLVGLFERMRRQGSRLGGMSGQRVLRNIGRDSFILTADVLRCLQRAGLDISANPTSKRQLGLIQATFNQWHRETGLPYAHLSRICACSVD